MANEKRFDHKEYARQMRTHAVADAGVIRVSTELWEQIADIVENSVEVVHGRWQIITDDYDCEMMQCSVCEEMFYDGDNDTVDCLHNYCPHCGAKMDGGNEDV